MTQDKMVEWHLQLDGHEFDAISSLAIHFSPCPESFLASGSFTVSWLLNEVAKELEPELQDQSFQ